MYNILVCDDEKDIVKALGIYLSAEGYQVTKAYNGQEACEKLKTGDVQLVLMDIMMPVMDGITAMNEIRKTSNVPVILLTAKSEDTDKILGQEGTVAVHIRHLREKIEADPSEPRYIKVVWGQGYMFGKE